MTVLSLFFRRGGTDARVWALPSPKRSEELLKETESSVLYGNFFD